MWNFGLDRLRLVAPARRLAESGAPRRWRVARGGCVERRVAGTTTAEACADLSCVFATTARERAMTKLVLTAVAAMVEARAMVARGERVGFLLGPERAGLANADVARANAIVTVPVNPGYGSLNLGQCALILAYEWQRAGGAAPTPEYRVGDARLAAGGEVDRFLEHLVERLDAVGFFFPPEKRTSMTASLENLFRRAPLTDADVRTLHGVVRALAVEEPARK